MIRIKNKTNLRKILRKKERVGGTPVINMKTGEWFITLKDPASYRGKEKEYSYTHFLTNVGITDSIITQCFNKIEAEMNKPQQTPQPTKENTEETLHTLKVQLTQLRAVTDSKASQIKLLQDNNKELQEDKKEYLNRLTYLGNKLRDTEADNRIYKEEVLKLKEKVKQLETHRDKLLDLL